MGVNLFEHQKEGARFLVSRGNGLLAFEQGLGKTLVAIEAFRQMLESGRAERLLVICPNSLKRNWAAEIAKFAPSISVDIAEGAAKERRKTFSNTQARVVVTSYETARNEVTSILALARRKKTILVLDESHATKNAKSQTSVAALQIAPYCCARWLLSGTPVTNKASDLHTQIGIMEPNKALLGSLELFRAKLEEDPSAGFAQDVLHQVVMRRTKEQCLDLPNKLPVDVRLDLPAWQKRIYDDMRDEMICQIKSMNGDEYRAFAPTALTQLTRLIQIASNPSLIFPELERTPAKFEVLDGLIKDILSVSDRKIILWSNYVRSIETLLKRHEGAVAIYGKIPVSERQEIVTRFQKDPAMRLLIANPSAGGVGFTLTAANYAIYESLSWRYDHYVQSQDRNHRIGQTKPVTYMRLIAADTIEEAIVEALERKSSLAKSLLGDSESGNLVAQLSKEEMCELLISNRLPEKPDTPTHRFAPIASA